MKVSLLILISLILYVNAYSQTVYPGIYHSVTNDFYARVYMLNDSLSEVYFFCPQNDKSAYMDLVFVKKNRCMSFNEHRLQDTTISEFFDINDSTKNFIKPFYNGTFKIGSLLFKKYLHNSYGLISTTPKYKFSPKIDHDNYYYALKKGLKVKTIRLYEEPTLLSSSHEFDLKENFSNDFTVSTKDFYFEQAEAFSLIGFGEQIEEGRFTKLYYIRNEDLDKFFTKYR